MRFKFEANQDYQLRAIKSVANLLEGQPHVQVGLDVVEGAMFTAVPNRMGLDDESLLKNIQLVQTQNNLDVDAFLEYIEEEIITATGEKTARFPNFSVEMETGTGKTYVYLRTILELFRCYGLRKFIIVVPSVAVREGVLKTLEITRKHLSELYDNAPYRYYAYDSANLSQIRQFALSDSVEIMVMTIDSFNKSSNVIRQTTDRLQGETPIHLVQATRPILILDEPQNMVSELRVQALAALDPLFALRYSATHRNPYNLIYRLTPYEAYQQGLVKRIEVAGVEQEDDVNPVFIRVEDIQSQKRTLTARVVVHKLMKNGTVKEQSMKVKPGDDLQAKTSLSQYDGYTVDEISLSGDFVRFLNGVEVSKGESRGPDKAAIFEAQIRYTIEEHFRKQDRLRPSNIKVLSLFFIDRVDNYIHEDGMIRRLFNKCFNELKEKYPNYSDTDVETVQAAYFAQRRLKGGELIYEDSKTGESQKDTEAYDLIMKDKERLLSFEEPTSFIFSHSALREGWDSPNVFQICTLNQTASEMKKRQEIGRGVRLAVNQLGDRVRDERINVLTVVANESYASYVQGLQTEIEEEYGTEGLSLPPTNARKPAIARLQKEYTLKPEFRKLWKRIKHKTRYAVTIDTEKLISEVVNDLDEAKISDPRITITKGDMQVEKVEEARVFSAKQASGTRTVSNLAGSYSLPNMVEMIAYMLEYTTPPMRLTRRTLLEILRRTQKRQPALDNPHEFAAVCTRIIREKLKDQLVDGVRYEKINEWYEMSQLDLEIETLAEYLIPAERSLYDPVICDSKNEKQFVEGLENRKDVKLYLKLPSFFKVPTPIGSYNPDWAIVVEDIDEFGQPTGKEKFYLVRETKDTINLDELRPDEKRKINCGKKHFGEALGVDYEVVNDPYDLRIKS